MYSFSLDTPPGHKMNINLELNCRIEKKIGKKISFTHHMMIQKPFGFSGDTMAFISYSMKNINNEIDHTTIIVKGYLAKIINDYFLFRQIESRSILSTK